MADPRQEPALLDHGRLAPIFPPEQLQGHRSIEPWIAGAIDIPKRAAADLLDDVEGSPRDRRVGGARVAGVRVEERLVE